MTARGVVSGAVAIAAVAAVGAALMKRAEQPPPRQRTVAKTVQIRPTARVEALGGNCVNVNQGSSDEADRYYDLIATRQHLGVAVRDSLPPNSLRSFRGVLSYVGSSLTPIQLASMSADELDAVAPAGRVVSATFFAPKTSQVLSGPPAANYNWRKLVRIAAAPDSPADAHQIAAAFILFNVINKGASELPRFQTAQFVQVMLIPREDKTNAHAGYWLLYTGVPLWTLLPSFNATFDGGDFDTANITKPYFVPDACGQCHGGTRENATLNFLDTDHWADRVKAGDDFEKVSAHFPVLLDAGSDPSLPRFRKAFERVKILNGEIAAQSRRASAEPFRQKAVEQWLRLHDNNPDFVPPVDRGFRTEASGGDWTAADEPLLRKLEQYCYRCHSTIAFSVFDRTYVVQWKTRMAALLRSRCMPRDRPLNGETIEDLAGLLENLQ